MQQCGGVLKKNFNFAQKPDGFWRGKRRDVGRLCSSVVRAVDRQSKDLGSNPSAVESVFFSTETFSNSLILYFSSNHKTGRSLYGKKIRNKLRKTQVDRMICYRVTAAANLKNVVLRKTRLKIKVLFSLL